MRKLVVDAKRVALNLDKHCVDALTVYAQQEQISLSAAARRVIAAWSKTHHDKEKDHAG